MVRVVGRWGRGWVGIAAAAWMYIVYSLFLVSRTNDFPSFQQQDVFICTLRVLKEELRIAPWLRRIDRITGERCASRSESVSEL